MAIQSWRKIGGPGWAAMGGHQLQTNNNNHINNTTVEPFPTSSTTTTTTTNNGETLKSLPSDTNKQRSFQLQFPPPEPDDLEEESTDDDGDNLYLRHRREALRESRLASRHSDAAERAFQRGDHASARRHSIAASRHRSAAESLHSEAAEAISAIRNPNLTSDLDLHGLHVPEALRLLQDRLQSFPATPRRNSISVITGVGKHSRGGQASLPSAVKCFLNQNRFYFEETKPGVISVRLKYRLPI